MGHHPISWIKMSSDSVNAFVMEGRVVSVSRDGEHNFSKGVCEEIVLHEGLGVEGDSHAGVTVKHLSRVAVDPAQPNLRQVHLIHSELFDELKEMGFSISPGDLGENILTEGLDLLALPRNSILRLGDSAVVNVTGLRNPCKQIDDFQEGLLAEVAYKNERGNMVRKAGIMGVVLTSGPVSPGDRIEVELPPEPFLKLERV
jgi:MOSC domain-containing protein YiiM